MKKRALIIGGSSGIGLATAKKLLRSEFDVTIIHRDRRLASEQFLEDIKACAMECNCKVDTWNVDAIDPQKISECLTEIQSKSKEPFALVLHAVSKGNLKSFVSDGNARLSKTDLELSIASMGTNLQLWCNGLLDLNLMGDGSRLVALTSEGNNRFWKGYGAVALAKSALETMCNYLAVELAPKGVRVNVVQAGITETPSLNLIPGAEDLKQNAVSRNPYERMTTPEDVADAIYLLTLPEALWINGALIHVDGGEHLL